MRGVLRIKRTLHKIQRRLAPGTVILAYHRIIDLDHDPYYLAVSPANFADHMRYIKNHFKVKSLGELEKPLRNGEVPRRAVAITFDDGYSDLLRNAYPVLKELQIPATVFVSSRRVGSQCEFWWDELDRIFLLSEKLPPSLNLSVNGRRYNWHLNAAGDRAPAFWKLHGLVKSLGPSKRQEVIDRLASWAGSDQTSRPDYMPMTKDELIAMSSEGLLEIGSHTLTHASLASLSEDEQRAEIFFDRDCLAESFDRPIKTFAYPYGLTEDFTDKTVEIVKEAGFSLACTMIGGGLRPGEDVYQLRRCMVLNWDLPDFVKNLTDFFAS